MPGTGCMCSIRNVWPEDLEMTSVTTVGSTPKASARRKASLTATADTPAIRLLQSFTTSPLPTGPTWKMLAPMASRTGRAAAKSSAEPPTMMASVPSTARGTPPDTGASTKRSPRSTAAAATRRETPGSIVDMSTQSVPLRAAARTPPSPEYADSTLGDDGSIVTTTSAVATTSAALAAAVIPAAAAACTAAGFMSKALTANPFFTRFFAMGSPIVPTPMNPIRVISFPPRNRRPRRRGSGGPAYTGLPMLSGLFLIALAAVSWGTTGATMALLARDAGAGPLLVGWARMAVAAPCLVLLAVLPPARTRAPRPERWTARDVVGAVALGAAMAAYQVCYFSAIPRTGVAVTALLAICSAPLCIALLAAAFLGERLTASTLVALVMAVTGAGLLVLGPRGLGPLDARAALGALLALGAGVSYAAYAATAKALLARRPPLTVAAATFSLAALFLSPSLAAGEALREPLVAGWPLFLALGIGPTAIAYALFTAGLARVPATAAGIASLLEPVTAATLGGAWFGGRLGAAGWRGGAPVSGGSAALLGARGARAARP